MRKTLLTAALFSAPLHAASAAEYTLLIFEAPAELAKRADAGPLGSGYWRAYRHIGQAMTQAGVLRGGAAIESRDELTLAGARLGGYFVIDVTDQSEAERWAAMVPAARTGGHVLVAASAASPAITSTTDVEDRTCTTC